MLEKVWSKDFILCQCLATVLSSNLPTYEQIWQLASWASSKSDEVISNQHNVLAVFQVKMFHATLLKQI